MRFLIQSARNHRQSFAAWQKQFHWYNAFLSVVNDSSQTFVVFLLAFPTKYIVCHYILPLISVSVSATSAKRPRTLRLRFLNETEIYLELKWFNVTLSNNEAMNIRRAYFVFSFRCHHAPHKSNGWHNLTMKCECVLFMRAKDMPTAVTIINNASSFVHSSGLLNGTFHISHNDLINSLSSRDI